MSAVEERDPSALREILVPGDRLAWIEDGQVRYRSAQEVLSSLLAFPAGTPIHTQTSDLEVVPIGERGAHAWTRFETTVGEGEGAFSFRGIVSFVLERTGGSWRIVGGHTSSPRQPSSDSTPYPRETQDSASSILTGLWEGQNEDRGRMSFEFHSNGWVDWVAQTPDGPITMRVTYTVRSDGGDLLVELAGFAAEPLEGMVMFGRAHLDSPDSLRLDLEPAPPGTPDAHPVDLTSADVITLVRARSR
jgi:hypothetical protein